jgi:hypothetical protein
MGPLRRLRALMATAGLWALAWATAAVVFIMGVGLFARGASLAALFPDYFLIGALSWGLWGGVNGACFALLLMFAEQRRTLQDLSRARIALWGAIGGVVLPLATSALSLLWPTIAIGEVTLQLARGLPVLASVLVSGTLGAVVAAGHLSLARRLPAAPSMHSLSGRAAT